MTHEERVTVSIYTGVLMCDFGSVHKRIEELLCRPVWTHELADNKLIEELKEKVKHDFMKLCEGEGIQMSGREYTEREKCACGAPAFITGCDNAISPEDGGDDYCICRTGECPWTRHAGMEEK